MPATFTPAWHLRQTQQRGREHVNLLAVVQFCTHMATEVEEQNWVTFDCSACVPQLPMYQPACKHLSMFCNVYSKLLQEA